MKVLIKHILITVKELKPGFVILTNGLFGVIETIGEKGVIVTLPDGNTDVETIDNARRAVVKFLAVKEDLKNFPIIHGNFNDIIANFDTKEKVAKYIGGQNVQTEGDLRTIQMYPKPEDVVELKSIEIAEANDMLSNKQDRIGIVKKIRGNKFTVQFPKNKLNLIRNDFEILSGLNSKQVFELKING